MNWITIFAIAFLITLIVSFVAVVESSSPKEAMINIAIAVAVFVVFSFISHR